MERLVALADAHADWVLPGYTHMQRAQPVTFGHHLLAYFWMFLRDVRRFHLVAESTGDMPAGSGALAGLNWDLDRKAIATELGFERPAPNSLDAVSNRDFALDYLYAASACAMHLSRLGGEIVLWSSQEFGFCEPADSFASGSSIMPQKKNPDAAELLRGKAPRIAAALASLLGTMHGLPLAYSKDLQEDKEPLFDAADILELCLEAAGPMLAGLSFNRERLRKLPVTIPRRLRHRRRPGEGRCPSRGARDRHRPVRNALEGEKSLSELGDAELDGFGGARRLRPAAEGNTIESEGPGGTSRRQLEQQLDQARHPGGTPRLRREFFDRSVHDVLQAGQLHRGGRGRRDHRRDGGL
jgi:hypothetical protein